MKTFGWPTRPETLLPLVEAKIVLATGYSADYVFTSDQRDEAIAAKPPAETFVVVRPPERFRPNAAQVGGGRTTTSVVGDVSVSLWHRADADQEARAEVWYNDATLGVTAKFFLIVDGLQMFCPETVAGRCLLEQPMRLTGADLTPRRVLEWGRMQGTFEMMFRYDLTL